MKDLLDLCKSEFRAATWLRTSPQWVWPSSFLGLLACFDLQPHFPLSPLPPLTALQLFPPSNNPNSNVIPALDFCTWNCLYLKHSASRLFWLGSGQVSLTTYLKIPADSSHVQSHHPAYVSSLYLPLCKWYCFLVTCVVKAWILSQPFFLLSLEQCRAYRRRSITICYGWKIFWLRSRGG